MKRGAWVICYVSWVIAVMAEGTGTVVELDFDRALALALTGNRELQAARMTAAARGVDVDSARATFLPVFRPAVGTAAGDEVRTTTYGAALEVRGRAGTRIEGGADGVVDIYTDADDLHRERLYVRMDQPLLRRRGERYNTDAIRTAESGQRAALRELEIRRTDLVVQLAELYEDILALQQEAANAERSSGRMEAFARLAGARERQGRSSRVEAMQASLKAGTGRNRRTAAEARLRSREADLVELLNLAPGTPVRLQSTRALAAEVPDLAAAVATAWSNRLDYAQILDDHADAARGQWMARRNLLPDLDLVLQYEQKSEGTGDAPGWELDRDAWFVGLNLESDWPDRTAGHVVERADWGQRIAALRVESVRAAIARQVEQALLAYRRAEDELPVSEANYELARQRMELANRLFSTGRIESQAVADAEDEFRQAEDARLAARSASSLAAYRLKRTMGTLIDVPPELTPGGGTGAVW